MAAAAPHLGDGPMSDPSYLVQTVIDLGRNGMTMDVKETLDFQNAIKPWIRRAFKDRANIKIASSCVGTHIVPSTDML
jgi:hypothetical protein